MNQSNDCLKLLFAAGADASYCDEQGRTLEKLVAECGLSRIVRLLEKHRQTG